VLKEAPNENGVPVTPQVVVLDSSLFLEHACWFKLLQDDGKEMTPTKILVNQELNKGRNQKKIQDDSSW
jgi:hypothetical protein